MEAGKMAVGKQCWSLAGLLSFVLLCLSGLAPMGVQGAVDSAELRKLDPYKVRAVEGWALRKRTCTDRDRSLSDPVACA